MFMLRCIMLPAVALAIASCGESYERACRVGTDCASGTCSTDGRCVSATARADGASPGGDASVATDGAISDDAGATTDGATGCTPNDDGTVTREEVPLFAGLRATYKFATNAAVSTAGTTRPDGTRVWDLSGALAGDHLGLVETQDPKGTWWAADYAGAAYAAKLSDGSELLGVFDVGPGALSLRGVVSPTSSLTKTELTYNPVVPTLQFPMHPGSSWTQTSTVQGTAQGIFSTYTEKYDFSVDAKGEVVTPLGTYKALRLKSTLTRTVGLVVTTVRVYAFVAECAGTIARITSKDNEPNAEFTSAAEVMRISP